MKCVHVGHQAGGGQGRAQNRLGGQIGPGLLGHHVGRVPGGPGVVLARTVKEMRPSRPLLVFDMGGFGPPQSVLEIVSGRERCLGIVDPAGETRRDLLDQPQIAIRVGERAEGSVARVPRVRAGLAGLDWEWRPVPHVAHVDASLEELVMSGLDVGDDQGGLDSSRRTRREPEAEGDRSRRTRGCELNKAKSVHRCNVVVESPTQLLVEDFGPIDVSHRDDVVLELYRNAGCFYWAHGSLLFP